MGDVLSPRGRAVAGYRIGSGMTEERQRRERKRRNLLRRFSSGSKARTSSRAASRPFATSAHLSSVIPALSRDPARSRLRARETRFSGWEASYHRADTVAGYRIRYDGGKVGGET